MRTVLNVFMCGFLCVAAFTHHDPSHVLQGKYTKFSIHVRKRKNKKKCEELFLWSNPLGQPPPPENPDSWKLSLRIKLGKSLCRFRSAESLFPLFGLWKLWDLKIFSVVILFVTDELLMWSTVFEEFDDHTNTWKIAQTDIRFHMGQPWKSDSLCALSRHVNDFLKNFF